MKKLKYIFIIPALLLLTGASFFQKTGLVTQNTSVTASGGTTTLVATSNQIYLVSGSSTQTIKLPDATQLFGGWWFIVQNKSSGIVTVVDSGDNALASMKQGTWAYFWLTSNAFSTGNWLVQVGTQEDAISVLALQDLTTDFAPQYLNDARGDARYYGKGSFAQAYTGFVQNVRTNDLGLIDDSFIDSANLIPLTTKGDILVYGNSGVTRQPVGANGSVLVADSAQPTGLRYSTSAGTGDVVGPSSSTDNAIARFDGTNGKLIQNSGATISDAGAVTAVGFVGPLTGDVTGNLTGNVTGNVTGNLTGLVNGINVGGGSDTQVMFNDGGTITGESTMTYDKTNNRLTVEEISSSGGGTGANSERFGSGVSGSGAKQVVLGQAAAAGSGDGAIVIGQNAGNNGGTSEGGIAIGIEANVNTGVGTIAIGRSSSAALTGIAVGREALANKGSIAIGTGATAADNTTGYNLVFGESANAPNGTGFNLLMAPGGSIPSGTNQAVFGSETSPYNNFYLGEGITSTTPSAVTLQGSGASGSDVASADFSVAGGKGTGTATPGALSFKVATANSVSGASLQSLVERLRITRNVNFPQELVKPAAPASGYMSLYAKNDGNFYQQTSSGTETVLGGGLSSTLADGSFLVGNGSNIATAVAPTGDVTFNNAGVFAISSGVIVNADVSTSAALDRGKTAAATANAVVLNAGDGKLTGGVVGAASGQPLVWNGTTADFSTKIDRGNIALATANSVVVNAGDGKMTGGVAPGASGNVLTSNGTSWTSAAPSGGAGAKNFCTYTSSTSTTSTTIAIDDTIPQNTEGVELLTCTITPTSASSQLLVTVNVPVHNGGNNVAIAAIFRDSTADALATGWVQLNNNLSNVPVSTSVTSGSTSATTFKVRIGTQGGTLNINGTGTRYFGGSLYAYISVEEIL